MKTLLTLLTFIGILAANAQTGKISGTIIDAQTGEELFGATALIQGSNMGASVNLETGKYIIDNVSPGKYTVIYQFISYQKKMVTDIEVKANQTN